MTDEQQKPKIIAVSGVKNSGKTTLLVKLIPALRARGLRVGVIKHDGHDFEADVPDTDSYRHKAAGAALTAVFSDTKFSLVMDREDVSPEFFLPFCGELDLLLLEGFKDSAYPKIEVVRRGVSDAPVCDPDTLLAVATDLALTLEKVPVVGLEEIDRLAEIICQNGSHGDRL